MNAQENESILKSIEVLDKTADDIRKANTTAIYELQDKKKELALQVLDNNEYIKEYVNKFYDKFEDSFIDNEFLRRYNSFDFSKIPNNIKDELIEYMQDNYCMYYCSDEYHEGFTVDSFDNIYISYENEIFADFSKKSYKFSNDLDKFVKIELLMQEHGIYPDIVELGYYGEYYADYNMPDKYEFLKTAMRENEKKLVYILEALKGLFDDDIYRYSDNSIIEAFTPEFIKKIDNNISVEILNVELSDDFELSIEYDINTKLKAKDLDKLNVKYSHTKYNTTIITVNANIKEYLQEVIK